MSSRWIHDFAPRGDTRRYNPCSSVSFASPLAVSILRTVSLAKVMALELHQAQLADDRMLALAGVPTKELE